MLPHILVVDDERESGEAMARALKRANQLWKVKTVQAVEEAKIYLNSPPEELGNVDVVLTDLVMGRNEAGGMELLEFAKNIDPFVMVIVYTAKDRKMDRLEAFDFGAFDCVEKVKLGEDVASRELVVKTKAALKFRRLALSHIQDQKNIETLRRYFDPRVFDAVNKNPDLLAIHLRTTTIVFWDIRGFSGFCNSLKAHPQLIRGFLTDFYTTASSVIFDNNGILDKFIGDGVMALFFHFSVEDELGEIAAREAVKAALDLRNRFNSVYEKWERHWSLKEPEYISVGLGCGIHTGDCLVGNLGTSIRDQFTAIGPHVNFAARLESRSQAGQILLSSATARRVMNEFSLAAKGEIDDIKGIIGKHQIYEV